MTNTNSSFPASLQDALIPNIPTSMYYIHNFITSTEEDGLLAKVGNFLPLRETNEKYLKICRSTLPPSPIGASFLTVVSKLTLPRSLKLTRSSPRHLLHGFPIR